MASLPLIDPTKVPLPKSGTRRVKIKGKPKETSEVVITPTPVTRRTAKLPSTREKEIGRILKKHRTEVVNIDEYYSPEGGEPLNLYDLRKRLMEDLVDRNIEVARSENISKIIFYKARYGVKYHEDTEDLVDKAIA